jgi:hypothetical protein
MSTNSNIDYDVLRGLVRERIKPRGSFTPRGLSMLASKKKNPDLVRNLLSGTDPSFPSVYGLCEAMAVPLNSVIKSLPQRPAEAPPVDDEKRSWLLVNAQVEAGVWREQVEWGPEEWMEVEVDPAKFHPAATGVVVRGRSMDRKFPPGTYLHCVDLISSGEAVDDGDYVIAERRRGDLVELTCKKLALRTDGNWELRAESYLDEFAEPVFVGFLHDEHNENDVRIRALVIDATLPMPRRRTRFLVRAA